MQHSEKVSISITPRQANLLRSKVGEGSYASQSEIMREALRLWEDKEIIREERLTILREDIRKGVESGSAGVLDFKELRRKAKARLDAEKE